MDRSVIPPILQPHQMLVIADVHREDFHDSDHEQGNQVVIGSEDEDHVQCVMIRNTTVEQPIDTVAVADSSGPGGRDGSAIEGPAPDTVLPWSKDGLPRAQRKDVDIGFIIAKIEEGQEKPAWDTVTLKSYDVKTLWAAWDRLSIRDGLLKRRFEAPDGSSQRWQVIWPK